MSSLREWLYPETKRLPHRIDRQAALSAARSRLVKTSQFWIVFAFAILAAVVLPRFVHLVHRQFPTSLGIGGPVVGGVVLGALQGLCFGFGFQFAFRKPTRRFLREYLNQRGYSLCVHCGYDLRGQTTPRCPECGNAFDADRLSAAHASQDDSHRQE